MKEYNLDRCGPDVKQLLNKIDDLQDATPIKGGTMAADDKRKLDQLEQDEELSIEEINELLNF